MIVLPLAALVAAPLVAPALPTPATSSGSGDAYIAPSVAALGQTFLLNVGDPNAPGGVCVLGFSCSLASQPLPGVGDIALDVLCPDFFVCVRMLDAAGDAALAFPLSNDPAQVGMIDFYAQAFVDDLGGKLSLSKPVRLPVLEPDGYHPVGSLMTARALHEATSLADGPDSPCVQVLITGGGGGDILIPLAVDTTELYDPLTQTFLPGPKMSLPRTAHRDISLGGGRVLITGGTDSNGNVTSSCELYDAATGQLTAAASMNKPRIGHTLTRLADGRVLATGGFADYTQAAIDLKVALGTVQDTGEIYDPVADTWTLLTSVMSSGRGIGAATLLADGRVLISGGIDGAKVGAGSGADIPTYTATCDLFDPQTSTFTQTGDLSLARAFHGQSILPNGTVLSTGGTFIVSVFGAETIAASNIAEVWSGGTWTLTDSLEGGVAYHSQLVSQVDGSALIHGGLAGTVPSLTTVAVAARHDGTTRTKLADIGTNGALGLATPAPRGIHSMTRLYDGSYLIVGGTDYVTELSDAFVWTE